MNTIKMREWSIGPSHDPYSAMEVVITNPATGARAELYEDGLGQRRAKFTAPIAGAEVSRREQWWHQGGSFDQRSLKANLLARRTTGQSFDDAIDAYYESARHQPSDPYHGGV